MSCTKKSVYCIENKINGKKYVGKTDISVEARLALHLREYKKHRVEKRPLYAAMRKYGPENFQVYILEVVTDGNLDEREIYWIQKLDTYNNGYNATLGGEGSTLYDTQDFINDFENGMLAKEIAVKYKCDRDTVTRHLTAAGYDTKANETARKSVAVNQYTKDGKFIRTHKSISAAARYIIDEKDLDRSEKSVANNIRESANGKRKYACEYSWKYAS